MAWWRPERPLRQSTRLALAALVAVAALLPLLLLLARQTPLRRRAPAPAGSPALGVAAASAPELADRPLEEWTPGFRALLEAREFETLDGELTRIAELRRDAYEAYGLAYLHARVKIETGDLPAARALLEPFLAADHPLRDLALHYRANVAQEEGHPEEASRLRQDLIFSHPKATYRSAAIAEEAAYLAEEGDAGRLGVFLVRLAPRVEAATLRQVEARLVERLVEEDQDAAALQRGLRLLRDNATDDAADRVFRALDDPRFLDRLGPSEWVLLGESARGHRHFDRAIPLLERALPALPAQREELLFSIGRAYFGQEDYATAEKTYLAGANASDDAESRVNFLYHAARAAQLRADDATAERYLTRAIASLPAVPARPRRKARRRGRAVLPSESPRTAVAFTQRLRLRLGARRFGEAEQDLRQIQRLFPGTEAVRDGTLAYAAVLIESGREAAGLRELEALRLRLGPFDAAEADYWKARAAERSAPDKAVAAYLRVLRAEVPTHFAYFARRRLAEPALVARVQSERQALSAQAERLLLAGDLGGARRAQTDVVLLTPPGEQATALARLADIYRALSAYREILELQPWPFPRIPLPDPVPSAGQEPGSDASGTPVLAGGRLELLLAMGLFDDAIDDVMERYALARPATALTRSLALNLGAAPRESVRAIEVLMQGIPDDFVPQLLPALLRRLLYPRYFYDAILDEARRHGADPRLVVSIMREESRFDPRAKSAAAARGLLQFIITTARDVGQKIGLVDLSPEDLYDPRIVIRLGTRYIADLQEQFGRDPYKAAAAYNAGPNQVALWARMSPGPGADAFLTTINFEETKNYVRKVLNSYERYAEIYEGQAPVGGIRVEP
jgi:soluble lytic murein transglycosylase-like protein